LLVPFEPRADGEPTDADGFARDLAERVNALLADPSRAERFGAAGRARVLDRFTWPAVAGRTLELYRRLVARGTASNMTGPNRGMMQAMEVKEGRRRVVIEGVQPEVDGGRFPIKRTVGERVVVEADVFADGHDLVAASLLHRREQDRVWSEVPMAPLVNDRWRAAFPVTELGWYRYTLRAWIDRFGTWRRDFGRKLEAGQSVSVELRSGVDMVERAAKRATGAAASALRDWARRLPLDPEAALLPELAAKMASYPDRRFGSAYGRELSVVVDRERARFSAWYELFPRSAAAEPGRHGTFADVEERLPYIQDLGFDVVYLPPIHPIGRSFRKGRDNAVTAEPGDPGSPWAIGAEEGGHTSINPELGPMKDFERLVEAARVRGMEIAARPRLPVLSRPSVPEGAPGVVPAPPRRHHPVRGEPTQEVPGHLPAGLRDRRVAGTVGRARFDPPVLDRARRPDLPGRQPAHQAVSRSGSGCSAA